MDTAVNNEGDQRDIAMAATQKTQQHSSESSHISEVPGQQVTYGSRIDDVTVRSTSDAVDPETLPGKHSPVDSFPQQNTDGIIKNIPIDTGNGAYFTNEDNSCSGDPDLSHTTAQLINIEAFADHATKCAGKHITQIAESNRTKLQELL